MVFGGGAMFCLATFCLAGGGGLGVASVAVCEEEPNLDEMLFSHDARRPSPCALPVELLRPSRLGRLSLGFWALLGAAGVGVVGKAAVVSLSGLATAEGVTTAGFGDRLGSP